MEKAAASVEQEFGPIDIWVNNAMASVFSPVTEMHPEEYKRVTEVRYLGVVYGTLAALKQMLPRDRGTIVQVGSALVYRSIPLQSAYCAAKHAIAGFSDSLRCELIHDKSRVRVTMVQMPALNTPQFGWVKSRLKHKAQPVPPIFQPEVGATAIYWAAHHKRREEQTRSRLARPLSGENWICIPTNLRAGKSQPARQFMGAAERRLRRSRHIRTARTRKQLGTTGQPGPPLDRRWIGAGVAAIAAAVWLASRRG
jgi:NAD(P)-dependent dehydrogenase (short-subunit alcohol dehydrogenase family)